MTNNTHQPIPDSEYPLVEQSTTVDHLDEDEGLLVTVLIRSAAPGGLPSLDAVRTMAAEGRYLSREEFASTYGAAAEDIAAVEGFAREHNLQVIKSDAAKRSVILAGMTRDLNAAFHVNLMSFMHEEAGAFRGHTGYASVPANLAGIVKAVLGLNSPPVGKRRSRIRTPDAGAGSNFQGYHPAEVAGFYNFPSGLQGAGQCIGIIELGGGYYPNDLSAYFGANQPNVISVGVNEPNPQDETDGEVALDIDVVGAIAPKATIVVYFPDQQTYREIAGYDQNSFMSPDAEIYDTVTNAIHDSQNRPSVLSISYGWYEAGVNDQNPQFLQTMNEVFQSAGAMGISVCISSGDTGAYGMSNNVGGSVQLNFPADCPSILSVGGTLLHVANDQRTEETVWNSLAERNGATGGGFSQVFPLPSYQQEAVSNYLRKYPNLPGGFRGVPDIAANADPASGFIVIVNQQAQIVGGTSAAAPLWAALIALINEQMAKENKNPVGFANHWLYQPACIAALNQVVPNIGNGFDSTDPYQPAAGWDPCTGLGTPDGQKLLEVFSHLLPPL